MTDKQGLYPLSNPRRIALNVINRVFDDGAYLNIALDDAIRSSKMTESDKHLATHLVYGVVSKRLTLEWYLKPFVKKTKKWVKHLLMLALYQMVYMDRIPVSAAVDEAVKYAKKQGDRRLAGFVNGVLRNISRQGLQAITDIADPIERMSIQYSVPLDLLQELHQQFGSDRCEALLASLETPSKASIRVNTRLTSLTAIQAELADYQLVPSSLSKVGLVAKQGYLAGTSAFKEGRITIQDESSQLVASVLAASPQDEVLDACAAPGGKTTHIATYLAGGHVTALDLYDHKLNLIQQNARRQHLDEQIHTQKMDARTVDQYFSSEQFDKILVDAPCSGLGLMRRKPDIKYRKNEAEVEQLPAIQLAILASCAKTLKKGGIMVYSTCTIIDDENFQVIEAFLAQHPEFELIPIAHEKTDIVMKGCILITPEQYQTDGFFIAKLRKKA